MKTREVCCDVQGCDAKGTLYEPERDVDPLSCPTCGFYQGDAEGTLAPERWGAISLADSNGELQEHFLCPVHNMAGWELLRGGDETRDAVRAVLGMAADHAAKLGWGEIARVVMVLGAEIVLLRVAEFDPELARKLREELPIVPGQLAPLLARLRNLRP